jgi:hypothetical protein
MAMMDGVRRDSANIMSEGYGFHFEKEEINNYV